MAKRTIAPKPCGSCGTMVPKLAPDKRGKESQRFDGSKWGYTEKLCLICFSQESWKEKSTAVHVPDVPLSDIKREYLEKNYSLIKRFTLKNSWLSKIDGDELLQYTFLKICRCVGKFKGEFNDEAHFRRYVFKVCRNSCMNFQTEHRKKNSRFKNGFVSEGEGFRLIEDVPPVDYYEEAIDEVLNIISFAGEHYREILMLRHIHGFENEEIAAKMGLTKCSVNSRLVNAHKKIYQKLSKNPKKSA